MNQGIIFDTKPYSINDGPGIRFSIYLKGCPLNCAWCHNPESISPKVQKMYSHQKCIGCMSCVESCPFNALTLTPEGIATDGELCTLCGLCAIVCPTRAMEMIGKPASVQDLMGMIRKEITTIDQSNGGVTISGGEPLQQSDFLIELLDAIGAEGIHRAVDTSGMTSPERLLEVAKRTELFLYDLKLMDPEKHKKYTGVSNERILANLKLLAESGAEINIRIPLIAGVNADEDNLRQSAEFVASLAGEKKLVSLLPYHGIAAHKYEKLGGAYDEGEMKEPGAQEIEKALAIFEEYGLEVVVGG